LLPSLDAGLGFFLGPTQSGEVRFGPAP